MRYPFDDFKTKFNTTVGNGFGDKVPYGFHSGVDINGNGGGNSDCGSPIKAIADGECTSVELGTTGYGKHFHYKIDGPWGVRYVHDAHCQDIFIKVGDKFKEGDTIATMGTSGNSTHCHDHFEIKKKPVGINAIAKTQVALNDGWEDPIAFIEKYMVDPLQDCQVRLSQSNTDRDVNWNAFVALCSELGVVVDPNAKENTVKKTVEVIKELKKRGEDLANENTGLKKELKEVSDDNAGLHKSLADFEKRDSTAIDDVIGYEEKYRTLQGEADSIAFNFGIAPYDFKEVLAAQDRLQQPKDPQADKALKDYQKLLEWAMESVGRVRLDFKKWILLGWNLFLSKIRR